MNCTCKGGERPPTLPARRRADGARHTLIQPAKTVRRSDGQSVSRSVSQKSGRRESPSSDGANGTVSCVRAYDFHQQTGSREKECGELRCSRGSSDLPTFLSESGTALCGHTRCGSGLSLLLYPHANNTLASRLYIMWLPMRLASMCACVLVCVSGAQHIMSAVALVASIRAGQRELSLSGQKLAPSIADLLLGPTRSLLLLSSLSLSLSLSLITPPHRPPPLHSLHPSSAETSLLRSPLSPPHSTRTSHLDRVAPTATAYRRFRRPSGLPRQKELPPLALLSCPVSRALS